MWILFGFLFGIRTELTILVRIPNWRIGRFETASHVQVEWKMARNMSNAQAGLPQPARADLLAPGGGARNTRNTRETVAAGASFFVFLLYITCSQDKGHISHAMEPRLKC